MKLTRTLNITQDEFYDCLETDIIHDLYEYQDTEISAADIRKGLKYQKKDKATQADVTLTILNYVRGSIYQASIKTLYDTVIVHYETEMTEDGLKIIFQQHIKSYDTQKHHKLTKWFSDGIYLGRMSDTLFTIQKKINAKKNRD